MWNSCCEWLSGFRVIQEGYNNGDSAREPLNDGVQRIPMWSQSQLQQKMFEAILPRKLNIEDTITLTGNISENARKVTLSLVTGNYNIDSSNVAYQFIADFDLNITIVNIKMDGIDELQEGEHKDFELHNYLSRGQDFNITMQIIMDQGEYYVIQHTNGSFHTQIKLKHNIEDIRYLTLSGDINKVSTISFNFA